MTTIRFLWPLIMVLALIATGLILKYYSNKRRRKKKGLKQHPSAKSIN